MLQEENRPENKLEVQTLDYSYRAVVWDIVILAVLTLVLIFNLFEPVGWFGRNSLLYLACFVGSLPVIVGATRDALGGKVSMDLLSGLALIASILAGQLVSAIFIAMMLTASRILGDWSDRLVRRGVRSLLRLRPHSVKVEINDEIVEKPAHELKPGDIVIAESGRRIAVDGVVIDGEAAVDESSLTGESLPIIKEVNSRVFSSTLVADGHLKIKAEKVGMNTTLEKIVKLVEGAQAQKSRLTTLAEKFGKIYIIAVMFISVAIYYFSHNFGLVLSVILVVCADDVAVAVPLAYLIAAGKASRFGIIIKGSSYLESMSRAKVFLFDKTGTLTKGILKVDGLELLGSLSRGEVLSAVHALASESSHPVSKAVHKFAETGGAEPLDVSQVVETSGRGIKGTLKNKEVVLGNLALLNDLKIKTDDSIKNKIVEIENLGQAAVFFASGGKLEALFSVSDEVKTNAKDSMARLRQAGVEKIVMITGDSERVALKIAKSAGLTDFRAKVTPEDKLIEVKKHLSDKYTTVMVGDGVNDAAALSLADVGIAMGHSGFDVAIESADIVLMHDDLSKIAETMELSRQVRRVIKEDFWIWGLSNALGLFLVFGGFIGPSGAAAYNFLSDFFPLGNSVKIFFSKEKKYKFFN